MRAALFKCLRDALLLLILQHVIHAALMSVFPYGMAVGWYATTEQAFLGWLLDTPLKSGLTTAFVLHGVFWLVTRLGFERMRWPSFAYLLVGAAPGVAFHFWILTGHS